MAHPAREASYPTTGNIATPCPPSGKRRGSPVKGQQAIHAPRKSLCATTTGTHEHLFLKVTMRDRTYHALLDSGAQGNFYAPWEVNELELPWKQKEQPYSLDTVEGSAIRYDEGMVQRETAHLPIAVQNHHETLRFDITDIGDHPMILGIPWLRKHNPKAKNKTPRTRTTKQHNHRAKNRRRTLTRADNTETHGTTPEEKGQEDRTCLCPTTTPTSPSVHQEDRS